jgi:hypothetical protein
LKPLIFNFFVYRVLLNIDLEASVITAYAAASKSYLFAWTNVYTCRIVLLPHTTDDKGTKPTLVFTRYLFHVVITLDVSFRQGAINMSRYIS